MSDNHVSTGKSKSKRKDFVAPRVMITMALILFHEVLFIPLLNIKGGGGEFLRMTMTKIPIIVEMMMMMMTTHVSSYLYRDHKQPCNQTYIKDDVPKEPLRKTTGFST